MNITALLELPKTLSVLMSWFEITDFNAGWKNGKFYTESIYTAAFQTKKVLSKPQILGGARFNHPQLNIT